MNKFLYIFLSVFIVGVAAFWYKATRTEGYTWQPEGLAYLILEVALLSILGYAVWRDAQKPNLNGRR